MSNGGSKRDWESLLKEPIGRLCKAIWMPVVIIRFGQIRTLQNSLTEQSDCLMFAANDHS